MSWPDVLTQWSFDPSVVAGIGLAAVLYWRGRRRVAVVSGARSAPVGRWSAAAFYAGLLVTLLALESPVDALSASLFSFHMLQHLLLIMVAAPLLLLGDPALTTVRGFPLGLRRRVLGLAARQAWLRRAAHALRFLTAPVAALVIFTTDLYLWHWSVLFNLTLQNDTVHLAEHLCFLITALLFWAQVIDQRGLHGRLPYIQRAVYILIAAAAGNFLAMYFVFTPKALYAAYAHPANRLYGMTPLGDQQIAGALMWVPVLFLFGGAFAVCFYKALREDEQQHEAAVAGGSYSMPF